MDPLVTVIIPTSNRPQFIRRAIDSSLIGMPHDTIEVIVVPNGVDRSWQESLDIYKDNKSVRIIPIQRANANIARNVGLKNARGSFIRFLDDDDYLIPESSIKQYVIMQESNADIVSGAVKLVNENGRILRIQCQPDIHDFCSAVLGPHRMCANLVHVYKKKILGDLLWSPNVSIRQDVDWQIKLCTQKEIRWKKSKDVVGVWQQHWGERISVSKSIQERSEKTVPMLLKAHSCLLIQKRLTEERQLAVAQGLWSCFHEAFIFDPRFWTTVAQKAKLIDGSARPVQPVYNYPIIRNISPVLIQWFLFPKRFYSINILRILKYLRIKHK